MALVVGLGNPGEAYVGTRHNAGFWVLDQLRGRMKADAGGRRPEYQSWATTFRGHEVTLLQPLTFMNLSGEAVVAWRDAHGLELGALIVVADDVYLPVGHLRLRARAFDLASPRGGFRFRAAEAAQPTACAALRSAESVG